MSAYQPYMPPPPPPVQVPVQQDPTYYAPVPVVQPQQPYIPAPPPPPSYVGQVQTAPQYRPPQQVWPTPPPPPQYRPPQQAAPIQQVSAQPVAWAPVHFNVPPSLNQSRIGYYGYYPDQMWNALASVPPVWRPQQPGESFLARAAKNAFLVFLEKAAEQLLISTRQAFLPPQYRTNAPEAPAIDVTPK